MKESILFFGTPPAYYEQLLKRYGPVSVYSGADNWRAHTMIGVAGDHFTPEELEDFSKEVLAAGKVFGLVETDSRHLNILSAITGIRPYESCVGAIVTPWTDEAAGRHYKTIFFHRFTSQREAALAAQGRSADTLKYLLLKNALRMHFDEIGNRDLYLKFTAPDKAAYAVVPVQKRPVTVYANNIHGVTEVRFFHHADVWYYRPATNDGRDLYIVACHYLTDFSHGLYQYQQAYHVTETGPSVQLSEWKQYYTYALQCAADTDAEVVATNIYAADAVHEQTVFAGGIAPSGAYLAALAAYRHDHIQSFTTGGADGLPCTSWSLADAHRQTPGRENIPVPEDGCSCISVFHVRTSGQHIPAGRLSFGFETTILQEETHTVAAAGAATDTRQQESRFSESKTLQSEWMEPAILLKQDHLQKHIS